MKKITFRKLTIQNFLSVGEEPVIIEFHEGTNVITGFNRDEDGIKNAVGKCLDPLTKIKVRIPEKFLDSLPDSITK